MEKQEKTVFEMTVIENWVRTLKLDAKLYFAKYEEFKKNKAISKERAEYYKKEAMFFQDRYNQAVNTLAKHGIELRADL